MPPSVRPLEAPGASIHQAVGGNSRRWTLRKPKEHKRITLYEDREARNATSSKVAPVAEAIARSLAKSFLHRPSEVHVRGQCGKLDLFIGVEPLTGLPINRPFHVKPCEWKICARILLVVVQDEPARIERTASSSLNEA